MFVPARVDPEVPIEDTVGYLVELLREGKFDHIGLSECRADTLRRGHSVGIFTVSVSAGADLGSRYTPSPLWRSKSVRCPMKRRREKVGLKSLYGSDSRH